MKASTVKTWHWIHKWTSLVCTIFALLLCITGLPLIFVHEIDRALGKTVAPRAVSAQEDEAFTRGGRRARVDAMIDDALRRRPGTVVQFLSKDDDDDELYYVRLGASPSAERAAAVYAYDGRTGAMLAQYPLDQGVMNVVIRLHTDLFAGLPGMLFLGLMGIVLIASIVSGVVLYAPYMQRLAFGSIRAGRTPRILWLDIHNLIGIATLGWFFVVSVTGVVNTLSGPIFDRWKQTELAAMLAPYREEPVHGAGTMVPQRALEAALARVPDTELGFMAFPGGSFAGPGQFVVFLRGNTPWREKLLTPVLLDARDGCVLDTRALPLYVTALLVSQPLHFGDYGGLSLKITWLVLDLLSIVLLGSGLYLWLRKRSPPSGAIA